MKKYLAFVLVFVLVMSMSSLAWAEIRIYDESGTLIQDPANPYEGDIGSIEISGVTARLSPAT